MREMNWFDMAPWIAIAITLILSIVTPLLTQIANNRFQLKQQKLKDNQTKFEEKYNVYKEFAECVGSCISFASAEKAQDAGASIQKMYFFIPEEHWKDLDDLFSLLKKKEWDKAEVLMKELSRTSAKLLNEEQRTQ